MIEVVYCPISDGLVFLTRDAALERATLWKALNTARIWEVQDQADRLKDAPMLLAQPQAIFSDPLQHTYDREDENSVWCISGKK